VTCWIVHLFLINPSSVSAIWTHLLEIKEILPALGSHMTILGSHIFIPGINSLSHLVQPLHFFWSGSKRDTILPLS